MPLDPLLFTRTLLRWFHRDSRDLPWRRTSHPYRVWLSEIMLQQTRIETVIPYYRRFLRRFPSVRVLSRASVSEVLKAWEGLGYYARARNLHRGARRIVEEHRGRFPESADDWASLPGIGAYTAAAIASIVNSEPVFAVDGNVRRVVSRLLNFPRLGDEALGQFLGTVIDLRRPGAFNQAMMELGQRFCRPRSPQCGGCPVRSHCAALAAGTVAHVPARPPRRSVPHFEIAIGVCRKGGSVLVSRRKENGLLGGLWEFPGGKIEAGESPETALVREFEEEVGIRVRVGPKIVTVPHRYSHFSVNLHTYLCRFVSGRPRAVDCAEVRWVKPAALDRLAFPSANRKILEALKEMPWPKT